MVNFKPLHNILVIEKMEDEKHSTGGIALPKPDPDKPRKAKVLAVGPGVLDEEFRKREIGVQVGDTILYLRSHEKTFDIDGEDVTLLKGNGVLGKVSG